MARKPRFNRQGRAGAQNTVSADWSKGMVRDAPRTALPQNSLYNSVDFLLHQPGLMYKRGGTAYAGPAMTGSTYCAQVSYVNFPAGAKLLGVGDDGHLFTVTSGTTTDVATLGTGWPGVDTIKLRASDVILPASTGKHFPKVYDGSTVRYLGPNTTTTGSNALPAATVNVDSTTGFLTPVAGTVGSFWVSDGTNIDQVTYTGKTATSFTGCLKGANTYAAGAVVSTVPPFKYYGIYKTRIVGGGVSGYANRSYFSVTPTDGTNTTFNSSQWNTTVSSIDHDEAITGYAALANLLLIFSSGRTERIIGSIPPPSSDMDRAPVGAIGCTDARSIVVQEGNALFANPRGVYLTNGSGFVSLTAEGMIETYWQSLFPGYDPATWTIAAGTWRSFYFVSVMNGSTLVDTLMCNIPRRAWWRLSNIKGVMFSPGVGTADELYMADRSTNRVVSLSGITTPTASIKNDANGTAVAPTAEFRLEGSGPNVKHFGHGHITYDMRDAGSDNPTLAVTVAPGIEATTFAAVAESPLAETTDAVRARTTVAKVSQGVTVKVAQTHASSKTEVYALEVEERAIVPQAGGQ